MFPHTCIGMRLYNLQLHEKGKSKRISLPPLGPLAAPAAVLLIDWRAGERR